MQHDAARDADSYVMTLLATRPDHCIARYRANYRLGPEQPVTRDMIQQHWLLERTLTNDLLDSSPKDRAIIFEEAYTSLYRRCPWLTQPIRTEPDSSLERDYGHFTKLLTNCQTVYEVGSGQGRLIRFLAGKGHKCVATEITSERGRKLLGEEENITWHSTDGIYLAQFEPAGYYDAVVSTQVIEHLHPEDLKTHLENVREILSPGGIYIFDTPHSLFGPADLSRVFGLDLPVCMHLKEYTYLELARDLHTAGFTKVEAVFMPPRRARRLIHAVSASRAYLDFAIRIEAIADRFGRRARRRLATALAATGLLRRDISLCATK